MKYWIGKCIRWCVLGVFGIFAFGYIVMRLWNWLIPDLMGFAELDYLHALGLLALCKILFGSFSGKGGCSGGCGSKKGWGRHKWKSRLKEKMSNMSDEEKDKFNKGMGWCACGCPPESCNCGPECNCGCYDKKEGNCC
ncbi:MAG: hypothetical protein HRT71_17710 [Flavobacteriales bacterium]|nr:hypothetical protein [Flavobacteriales bacterium]